MPGTRLLLLASSFLLPRACAGQPLPADKDWSADLAPDMLAPGTSGNTTVHGMNVFRRHLEQPAVRRDGGPQGSLPAFAVSTDVVYARLSAARNGFDLGLTSGWWNRAVSSYSLATSLRRRPLHQRATGSFA